MSFEGGFKASKDYLQPILKNAVIALPFLLAMENIKRTALLIGIVYFAMHMMSSIASRYAHQLVDWKNGEDGAAHLIWRIGWVLFLCLVPLLWFHWYSLVIVGFVGIEILQNF